MIFKLGFRNIFRNRRRTVITCLIMGLGLAALIYADAFFHGLNENMITSVTSSFIGDGQIHRQNFLKTREHEKTITNGEQVLDDLRKDPLVKLAINRTIANGMIASPSDVLPIALYGIHPDEEEKISSIKKSLVAGNYLAEEDSGQILIGETLAKFLGSNIGDKVVITTAQAKTGTLSQELFRIGGIFKMKNKEMDSSLAFITFKKGQELMGIGNDFHEIVFKFNSKDSILNPPDDFLAKFSNNNNEALSWKKLVPAIDAGIQITSYSLFLGSVVLFAITALSTMNTMFMSLYERMYEFGIMKAIGTRPEFIVKLILMEATSLAVISIILGIAVGALITAYTHWVGINHFTDVEYLGTTIKTAIRPVFLTHQYIIYPIAILIFTISSAIYPAITAGNIIPSKSMRRD